MSRRGLQWALTTIGTVATVAGGHDVIRGTSGVRQRGTVSANVESEFRFYASWYLVFGVLLLRAARRPEAEATLVRAWASGFFIAGCSRVLSIRAAGAPHPWYRVLMAAEFALPAVVVPWQASVAAGSRERR